MGLKLTYIVLKVTHLGLKLTYMGLKLTYMGFSLTYTGLILTYLVLKPTKSETMKPSRSCSRGLKKFSFFVFGRTIVLLVIGCLTSLKRL